MRRTWSLSASRDGWAVHVREEPRWAQLFEAGWELFCRLTRGWAGGHGMPGWGWRIPIGRPRWDRDDPDEPLLINSLAGKLNSVEQWALSRTHAHGRELAEIRVDELAAQKIQPEFVEEMAEIRAGGDEPAI